MMAQRVNTLLETINKSPDGTNIKTLRNRFAVVQGVSPDVVSRYLKMLSDAGFIYENEGKVYPIKE